ncbi:MAG: arginase family protein [Candidatus Hermodarchaeota archaeon]
MNVNKNFANLSKKTVATFPYCIPANTYGTTIFLAEEYWTFAKIMKLCQIYPNLDFTGLIDPSFKNSFLSLIEQEPHKKIIGIKKYNEISEKIWETNRRVLNIATSHAPSRFIAQDYRQEYGDSLGIITIDAHYDLDNYGFAHGAWLTNNLADITAGIGGWAEKTSDLNDITSFAFFSPNFTELTCDRKFAEWLKGKKIHVTLDLDYFRSSKLNFLGYSNYWHREKIIGHSMNIEQELEESATDNSLSNQFMVGKHLGIFSDLENFIENKKNSIKKETGEIFRTIDVISKLIKKSSAKLLSIDFVEYSPICDWHLLTINEFITNYANILNMILPILHK